MVKKTYTEGSDNDFSQRLSTLMAEHRMTLQRASELVGVSCSTIQGWKTGSAPRDFVAVQKMARELGVSFSYLLTGQEEEPRPAPSHYYNAGVKPAEKRQTTKIPPELDERSSGIFNDSGNAPSNGSQDLLRLTRYISELANKHQNEQLLGQCAMVVTATSNGVVVTDATIHDQPIVYVNKGFERMTGYTLDEIKGTNCRFLQRNDRDQPERYELAKAIQENKEAHVVLRNYRKDGTPFWCEVFLSPVFDAAGRVINFISIQIDASKRKAIPERAEGNYPMAKRLNETDYKNPSD